MSKTKLIRPFGHDFPESQVAKPIEFEHHLAGGSGPKIGPPQIIQVLKAFCIETHGDLGTMIPA